MRVSGRGRRVGQLWVVLLAHGGILPPPTTEYLFYYTGMRPKVLTSSSIWYAGRGAVPYKPSRPEILLGPLRSAALEPAELTAAAGGRYSFIGVQRLYKHFTLEQVASHRAVVLLPYAVMSYGITEVGGVRGPASPL